ncbi:MAG: hypothetical protein Q4B68_10095 [Bacteroidales bacterium]|nr:hypothetical protein [Bacteroidales bacterium]
MKIKTFIAVGALSMMSIGAQAQFSNLLKQAKNKATTEVKKEGEKQVDKAEKKAKKSVEKAAYDLVGQGYLTDENYKLAACNDEWTPESDIDVLCAHQAYATWFMKESMKKAKKGDKIDLDKIDWENVKRFQQRKTEFSLNVGDAITNHKNANMTSTWYKTVVEDGLAFFKELNEFIDSNMSDKDGAYKGMNAYLKLLKKTKNQDACDYLWSNAVAMRNLAVEYKGDEIDENSKQWKNFQKDMEKQKSKVSAETLEKFPLTDMAGVKEKIQKDKEEAARREEARKKAEEARRAAEMEANTKPMPTPGMNDASLAAKCLAYAKRQYPDWKPVKAIIDSKLGT